MRAPSASLIEEIDGRDVRIGERWLADFASSDWLGLGLDEEVIDAIPEYLARWGTRAGPASGAGASSLTARLQDELAMLLGADECLVAPSSRHIHAAAIPALAKGGTVFLEDRAARALRDGCELAQARGATVHPFTRADLDTLATRLSGDWRRPGLICADGVHGETGSAAGLPGLAALARAHELSLYIDDAHGLGLLGRRDPGESCPYGVGGSGIVDHARLGWDGVILVASLADALCAPLTLLAGPARLAGAVRNAGRARQEPGEVSVATLATALEGLRA
ncbi:MAG: aminotransferase class I/II-fold pyridoxal phosphate-dependent enzyme, partial [Solirubrobacteraceae bacterium]